MKTLQTVKVVTSFTLTPLQGSQQLTFVIDQKKMIVGTHVGADIQLEGGNVSLYHAFLCLEDDGRMLVKDLASEAGTYVNGKRVDSAHVSSGDTVKFGDCVFFAQKNEDEAPVFNPDDFIEVIPVEAESEALEEKEETEAVLEVAREPEIAVAVPKLPFVSAPEAPAAKTQAPLTTPSMAAISQTLVLIDGELCDIIYDEKNCKLLEEVPEMSFESDESYTPLDETDEAFNLSHEVATKKFEIVSYMNGLVQDFQYIDLKNGDYFLSSMPKSQFDIQFHTLDKVKFFTITDGNLTFYPQRDLVPSSKWEDIDLSKPVFFTHGSEQISFRLIDKSIKWTSFPSWMREKAFFKQSSTIFASLFIPFLFLLFFTAPEAEKPAPEVVVIYQIKKPIERPPMNGEKSELTAEVVTSPTENTGHKQETQPDQKVEFSAASSTEKIVAKSVAKEVSSAPAAPAAPSKVVAKDTPAKPTPKSSIAVVAKSEAVVAPQAPVAAKPKPYKFSSSAVDSLVTAAPTARALGGKTQKGLTQGESFHAGSSADGDLVAGSSIGVSKLNGSDAYGSGSGSFGSRGLASKKGFDSSYLEPSTIVKGSMDPELLRKILREYIPQFRHCYQQELVFHSDKIHGVVDLNFTINPQGKAIRHNIQMKEAKFSQKGLNCMSDVLNVIEFPKPKGGGIVDVSQPLNFLSETKRL